MKKIICALVLLLSIVFFKPLQELALDMGFSWTASFSLPYFLLLLFGFLLAYDLRTVMKRFPKILRVMLIVVLAVLPFGAGFMLNPIYEGDYASEGSALSQNNRLASSKDADFVVLTIPNCPFCKESAAKISRLQQRNPHMRIKYLVCSTNPEATKELRKFLDKRISIQTLSDLTQALALSGGKFPTFLQIENGKAVYKWNNMQLGVLALDEIESSLAK